jgi:hypothetical protein
VLSTLHVLPDGLFVNFPHSKFLYDISRFYLRKSYRAPSYERLFLEGKKGSYAGLFLANVDVDELCTGAGLGASTGDGLRCGADEVVGLLDDAAAVGLGLFPDEPLVKANSLLSLASCSCFVWLIAVVRARSA